MLHLIILIITFVLAGIAGGFLSGFFGIGGGIVFVPIFLGVFSFFNIPHVFLIHAAIGTSLALIIPTAAVSFFKHYRLNNINFRLLKPWLAFLFLGTLVGSVLLGLIPSIALKIIFTVFIFLCAFFTSRQHSDQPDRREPLVVLKYIGAAFIGGISVLLGIGGGTLTTPLLKMNHYPIKQAIGISAAGGLLISLVGTTAVIYHGWDLPIHNGFFLGYINWLAFICIVPPVLIFAPMGVKTMTRVNENMLKWLYVLFLLITGFYMLYKTLHGA